MAPCQICQNKLRKVGSKETIKDTSVKYDGRNANYMRRVLLYVSMTKRNVAILIQRESPSRKYSEERQRSILKPVCFMKIYLADNFLMCIMHRNMIKKFTDSCLILIFKFSAGTTSVRNLAIKKAKKMEFMENKEERVKEWKGENSRV